MADLVYLSLWLRDFSEANMLDYWKQVVEAFPSSERFRGVRTLIVHPLNWQEAVVLEQGFDDGATGEVVASIAAEILHDDYAYEAEMKWDLWFPDDVRTAIRDVPDADSEEEFEGNDNVIPINGKSQDDGWRKEPVTVSISCLGPAFEIEESGDRPNILICLGLDTPFLPPEDVLVIDQDTDDLEVGDDFEDVDLELADVRGRENLQQLIALVHRLDESLPITKRLLWCESGENLAEKILDSWDVYL